jgi:hypothetical protein
MFDFAMVVASLLSVVLEFANPDAELPGLRELRVLRVMRLLRLVPKMTSIKCATTRQACIRAAQVPRTCMPDTPRHLRPWAP